MHAEDLSLDDGSEWQIVEGFIEIIPDVMIAVFLGDFIIEAVDIGYIARLVIAAEQYDHFWIFDLVEEEKKDCFDRVVATIHVIAKKDIALLGNGAAFAEQFEQVPKLAMDVSADGDWGLHWLHVRLFEENSLDPSAENLHSLLRDHLALQNGLNQRIHVHSITPNQCHHSKSVRSQLWG